MQCYSSIKGETSEFEVVNTKPSSGFGAPAAADSAAAQFLRARTLHQQGQLTEASELYHEVLKLRPGHVDALNWLGIAAVQSGDARRAVVYFNEAIESSPGNPASYCNRGLAFEQLQQWSEALESFDRAIESHPHYAAAHYNRAVVLKTMGEIEAALESYERSVAIDSRFILAHYNRGALLHELDRLDDAMDSYDRALAVDTGFAEAHLGRSFILLRRGDFAPGWVAHEWRWHCQTTGAILQNRKFSEPLWLGEESIAGKTLLIHSEQGLGDSLQFCRYVPMAAQMGAKVVLETDPPLASLLASLEGVSQIIVRGELLPPVDAHCPIMSLPLAFKTTLSTVPARIPYLGANAERVSRWRARLGETAKLKVGLAWAGGFRANQPDSWAVNERRNIDLVKFAVLDHPDLEFISLQKGEAAEADLVRFKSISGQGPHITNVSNHLQDFSDTAALIENLDLVISVDTAVAHLAGALGKPVWILNRFDSCWRWLVGRANSPWYPTAKVYQQTRAGDWETVLRTVKSDLDAWVIEHSDPS